MTIRPYLPPPRHARATVARMARRGRPPTAAAAARLSQAAAIVATSPGITGAELARRLGGIDPSYGARILAEVRASVPDLPPAQEPPIADRVVRLTQVQVDRLATFAGAGVREQLDAVLEIAEQQRATARGED